MQKTKIEWVKNPDGTQGYTLNSKTGCLNHTPEGLCIGGLFPCYAYKLANGRLKSRYLHNWHISTERLPDGICLSQHPKDDPFYPRFWRERLWQPYRVKKPSGFFLDDMSDWMGDYWPKEWTEQEIQMMRDNPHHRIYTLSKQPQHLIQFSPFPENCWVGITATGGEFAWSAGAWIRNIKAKVKFLSIEPFLQPFHNKDGNLDFTRAVIEQFDWIILGALTGTKYDLLAACQQWNIKNINQGLTLIPRGNRWTLQPKIEWVAEIVEAADRAGIPVFLKNNLKPMLCSRFNGQDFIESHDLWAFKQFQLRQEMPVGK